MMSSSLLWIPTTLQNTATITFLWVGTTKGIGGTVAVFTPYIIRTLLRICMTQVGLGFLGWYFLEGFRFFNLY
jgi:uncharacterized membrane protein (DUF106 family)